MFLPGLYRGVILKTTGATKSVATGGCEAEESPRLEAVARERLVKTQQAG
jgi:hypothetical protein